jgi:hypothetical protein
MLRAHRANRWKSMRNAGRRYFPIPLIILCSFTAAAQQGGWDALPFGIEAHSGAHLPTTGVIRGMVLFVQMPNDATGDDQWPLGGLPIWADRFSADVQRYYRDMSNGTLDLQLDVYDRPLIAPFSEDRYVEWGENYGDLIKSLLDSVDTTTDFAEYDNWNTANRIYRTEPGSDGKVDLLLVIYRSVARLEFLPYSGVSDLGYYGLKFVDGGISRYVYGGTGAANDAGSSGVTICRAPGYRTVTDFDFAFRVALHEMGHKFLGERHTNELYGGLGLMANAGNGRAMNGFERQLAGYIRYTMLAPGIDTVITLHDYVTTGEAFLLPLPELTRGYYSIEFRTGESEWDDAPARGVYIYRIYDTWGQNQKSIQVISAEGSFQWAVDSTGMVYPSRPDALFGYNRFQRIPINGRNYWAYGWWGDPRCAFTPERPDFMALKNPSPDFIFGPDTIRTMLHLRVAGMDEHTATVSISYQPPAILSAEAPHTVPVEIGSPYPQPVSPGSVASIPLRLERRMHCTVALYDMLGRHIHNVYAGDIDAGTRAVPVRTTSLPPGNYVLRVSTGTGAVTRPFIISR